MAYLLAAVAADPAVTDLARRPALHGLLTASRHRLTASGRRSLEVARAAGEFPAHVFDGPTAVPDRSLRRTLGHAAPLPSGLGKSLVRMGKPWTPTLHRNPASVTGFSSGGGGSDY